MSTRNNDERDIWRHRFNALDNMIGKLEDAFETDKNKNPHHRRDTFMTLTEKLERFAKAQFTFLLDGFYGGSNGPYLEPSLKYSKDFVLQATLDQTAFDLTLIQSAWLQRTSATPGEAMADTLTVADALAFRALEPAVRYGILPYEQTESGTHTVLTYFQKSPHIRIVPYAPVALIAIPYTAMANYSSEESASESLGRARDLLSIPHEVGHYVFRHGVFDQARLPSALEEILKGQPTWMFSWLEEIFADVYGCLVAGPVMARDFQDMMKDTAYEKYNYDDGKHPVPALRPLIYVDALTVLEKHLTTTKELVDESTIDWLRGMTEEAEGRWNKHASRWIGKEVNTQREQLKEVIEAAFQKIVAKKPDQQVLFWAHSGKHRKHSEEYDRLYQAFSDKVKDLVKDIEVPDLGDSAKEPLKLLPTLQWLVQIRNQQQETTDEDGPVRRRIPPEFWSLVVSMDGWATNGPEDNPNPK